MAGHGTTGFALCGALTHHSASAHWSQHVFRGRKRCSHKRPTSRLSLSDRRNVVSECVPMQGDIAAKSITTPAVHKGELLVPHVDVTVYQAAPSTMKVLRGRALRVLRLCGALVPLAVVMLMRANPVTALTLSGISMGFKTLDPAGFLSGLTASFVLVLASEIGDKTFFISALLSMKYSRVLVAIGTMLALGSMTVISVLIGQIFHSLPTSLNLAIPFDDYAAAALLLWFGFQNIRDGLHMGEEEDEELRDAEEVVDLATKSAKLEPSGMRVVTETTSLVFLAEWGDKSMLATVALAAAKSPLGVVVGGISGHFIATVIAVIGGSFLGKYISERNARLIGGALFWIFAVLTIFNLF